jgi:hypothetical protein
MRDFEAYQREFKWLLPDGSRDKERHNAFLNTLLDIICGRVKHHVAFGNVPVSSEPGKRVVESYERGIVDAIMYAGKESATVTFEAAEEQAWGEIEQYLLSMAPYKFQGLVADLLKAMG